MDEPQVGGSRRNVVLTDEEARQSMSAPPNIHRTIVDAIQHGASTTPDRMALRWLSQGKCAASFTYAELHAAARTVAAALQREDVAGRNVLVQAEGLDFVLALIACFYAGAIPVPAHQAAINRKQIARIRAMMKTARLEAMIGSDKALDEIAKAASDAEGLDELRRLPLSVLRSSHARCIVQSPAEDSTAFIQFTSGSTSEPKGVVVTHRSLTNNQLTLSGAFHTSSDTVMVSWLPLFHDLGLIFGLLHPLFMGGSTVLMSPMEFIRRPARWLRAISDYRATITGAPNFGYDYAVERLTEEDCDGLDLSSLQAALNGAEPVRAVTLDKFARRFAPYGFDARAFSPSYGLAEGTLCLTSKEVGHAVRVEHANPAALERGEFVRAEQGRALVSCGRTYADTGVVIVDRQTLTACDDGRIGEIWISGASVARGYINNPEATRTVFEATLSDGRGPFLRTGDLGFIDQSELFISGRCKDVIIVRGRNLYPQDIELTVAQAHDQIVSAGVAALSGGAVDQPESLVIVAEVRGRPSESDIAGILDTVATQVADTYEVAVADVVLIKPASLPKTSSGKVQRAEAARRYAQGELAVLGRLRMDAASQPENQERYVEELRSLLAELLKVAPDTLAGNRSLRGLGVDSLCAARLAASIETRLRRDLSLEEILASESIAELAERIGSARSAAETESPVASAAGSGAFPLTPMQQAYWVGSKQLFALGGHSLHGYFEFEGTFDVARLERAWNRVVAAHEMLRAVVTEDGQQLVLDEVPWYSIAEQNLRACQPQECATRLEQTREALTSWRFEQTRWPMFELRVSRLPTSMRLHCCLDGIFLDYRSIQVVLSQLAAAYVEPSAPLHTPSYRFRDYASSLAGLKGSPARERSVRFWREKVCTLAAPPQLPLVCEPDMLADARVHRREYSLPAERWEGVARRAAELGATPASVLLTAFARVLAMWSSQQRLTVNVPIFNRPAQVPGVNDVVGNFSSFVLVEADLTTVRDFQSDVRAVQRSLHEALNHSALSGVEILREISTQQGRINERGFPAVFTHLPSGLDAEDSRVLTNLRQSVGELVYIVTQTPQVWIDCQVWYEAGGVRLSWDCIDGLFPEQCIADMFAAFVSSIERIAEGPGWEETLAALTPRSTLELLSRNHSARVPPVERTVWDEICVQSARRPQAVAVVSGTHRITYAHLQAAVERCAERLAQAGVRRGGQVAVVMHKGWEQPVAVLAAFRLGCAYVPLDPDWPAERLRFCLADSGAQAVLIQPGTLERLDVSIPRISIAADVLDSAAFVSAAGRPATNEDVAYIIYTSGTSGTPKGVMVPHSALSSIIASTLREFDVGPADKVLSVTSLVHDLSVFDIAGVLSAGGTLVLPAAQDRRDPSAWLSLMQAEQVTLWNSVPALFDMLLDYVHGHQLQAPRWLRQAWLGGDWVTPATVDRARALMPALEVCSIGGPTETTLWNIWYRVPAGPLPSRIPYGRPAPGNRYYILNEAGLPCPVGVTGEMHCGGDGVALGYVNSPLRTAEKFYHHEQLNERLYRTGDLGRMQADGMIEILGRTDFQVKLQGVRIECGEIESTLLEHCDVSQAVVTVVGEGSRRELAAYVVPRAAPAADSHDFEQYTGAVITAVADRVSFKLARKAVRQLGTPSVELPHRPQSASDVDAYLRRQSIRRFARRMLSLEQVGQWLASLSSLTLPGKVLPKYRYPSGGGLYPVQTYLYVRPGAVEGLIEGYYYYDPEGHGLKPTALRGPAPRHVATVEHFAAQAGLTVYLVAALDAIEPLYGKLAQELCVLEAGYMGQLLMQQGSEFGLGVCPIGLQPDETLRERMQLNDQHQFVHCLVAGPIDAEQLRDWMTDSARPLTGEAFKERVLEVLRARLPAAWIPQHVVTLERLPLTANGKVDRLALRLPSEPKAEPAPLTAPPQMNDTEARLAAIWADLLGHSAISLDQNFFEMGGNSNLLVQFHVRMVKEFGRKIPVGELFRCACVRDLAALLDTPASAPSRGWFDLRGRKQREAAARRVSRPAPHV